MVFGTSPLMPGGAFEIPGFDPEWQTIAKHEDQTVTVTYEDETTTDVEVKAGSFLRVYRQHDAHGYNQNTDVEIDFDNCSDDIKELEAPVASGETLYFEFTVIVNGDPEKNIGVCVRTPPNPTGGFQVVSRSVAGSFQGGVFGADSFNNPAGVARAGNEGEVESHNIIRVRGALGNGPLAGLLKLQLGSASEGGILIAIKNDDTNEAAIVFYSGGTDGTFSATQAPAGLAATAGNVIYVSFAKVAGRHWILAFDGVDSVDLYVSDDLGVTWTLSAEAVNNFGENLGLPVEAADGTLWRLTYNGTDTVQVFKSTNVGEDWSSGGLTITDADLNPHLLSGIAADPTDPSRIAVVLADDGVEDDEFIRVWFTSNTGSSWTETALDETFWGNDLENVAGADNCIFTSTGRLIIVAEIDTDVLLEGGTVNKLMAAYSDNPVSAGNFTLVEIDSSDEANPAWGADPINGALNVIGDKIFCTFNGVNTTIQHVYASQDDGETWVDLIELPENANMVAGWYTETEDALYALFDAPVNGSILWRLSQVFEGGGEWLDLTEGLLGVVDYDLADIDPWFGRAVTSA